MGQGFFSGRAGIGQLLGWTVYRALLIERASGRCDLKFNAIRCEMTIFRGFER
jgi:hypothetical protein